MWEPTEVVTVRTDADQRRLRQLHKAGKLAVPEQWLNRDDDNAASFGTGARVMLHGDEAILTEAQTRELGITVAAGLNIDKLVGPVVIKIESHLEDLLAARLLLIARDGYAAAHKELSDLRLAEFNPDQARDERGRWTDNPTQLLGGLQDKFKSPQALGLAPLAVTKAGWGEWGKWQEAAPSREEYDRFAKQSVEVFRKPLEEAGFKLELKDVSSNMRGIGEQAAGAYWRDDKYLGLHQDVLEHLNKAVTTGQWDDDSKNAARVVVHELLHASSGGSERYPGMGENPFDTTQKLRIETHKMVEEGMVELLARDMTNRLIGENYFSVGTDKRASYNSYVIGIQELASQEEFLKLLQEPRSERLRVLGERVTGKLIERGILKTDAGPRNIDKRFNDSWNEQFTKHPEDSLLAMMDSPTRFYKALDRLEGEDLQRAYGLMKNHSWDWDAMRKVDDMLLTPEERANKEARMKEWEKRRKEDDRRYARSQARAKAARAAGRRSSGRRKRA